MDISLREMHWNDLDFFFEFQKDREANHMAAFTAKDPYDRESYIKHWSKILREDRIIKRTITINHDVVGSVICFTQFGEWEVTYWIDKKYWGKGIASRALSEFLQTVSIRPLIGRTAKDNIASRNVLEKNGFQMTGEDKGFANARREEVEEYIFTLSD
ncbi:GNAT family N-acetyltransferase [Halobacillus litoralis]|uniref:GNAT family N-acetyltransferase n=1 Tax=Halobacillus litoralis TaxID=45668 RepID=UPI001CFE01C8|nr:GNAT family N-acetyltransferase [Halobacillus litoralis]WLR47262.1 GNAT family N-acetyltransferase [Halobacillus litoralis]